MTILLANYAFNTFIINSCENIISNGAGIKKI